MRHAALVFDGINDVILPSELGTPNDNQLQGTPFEKLAEISSRICYDSFGKDENGKPKGRSTAKLLEHILEVQNHSIFEHVNITVGIYEPEIPLHKFYQPLINRKGVWVKIPEFNHIEITFNPRVLLEWERHTNFTNNAQYNLNLYATLYYHASLLMPQILPPYDGMQPEFTSVVLSDLDEDQRWISLYLANSRSWSHEQVRHRNAISQRSTRYVDESESPYVDNPLIEKYLNDTSINIANKDIIKTSILASESYDKNTYTIIVSELERYLIDNNIPKVDARKQARGAARDYLANALFTEMIYSINVSGWKWIIKNRLNAKADCRIRRVFAEVLPIMHSLGYCLEMKTQPSPDSIGVVLA